MRILIIEDDKELCCLLNISLIQGGYETDICHTGSDGLFYAKQQVYDTIVLDRMLPEIDGFELLEYIRPMNIPVIFLTAKGSVKDRIYGLKHGADDYIVKPFQTGEVLARIEAVLRRYGKNTSVLSFADVTVDLNSRKVLQTRAGIETAIDLTTKEFDLLTELIRNKNIAQYRDKLYEKVWNEPFFGDTRTLDTHIQRLRKKLGWESYIKTVFRIGYRLEECATSKKAGTDL